MATSDPTARVPAATPSAWPLVGRDSEFDRLTVALADAEVSGVLLAGPAGVGKTRLATECAEIGAKLGFSCERVLATQAAATIPLGALAPLLPPATSPDELRGDILRWAVKALPPDDQPFLLVVDDAHMLDPASAEIVHHLARQDRTFVVVTTRTGEALPDPVLPYGKRESSSASISPP